MPDTLSEYLALRKQLESLEQRKARLEGAEQEHLRKLKDEHGAGDLKEAKKLLAKLERREAEAKAEFEGKLKEFQEKWEGRI